MTKSLSILVALLLIGGFAYVALTDVPVTTQKVEKTIPQDQYLDMEN